MSKRFIPLVLALAVSAIGCSTEPNGGDVTIAIEQALTGQTTAAGTFRMTGALADDGSTTEDVVFGGPLDQSPVPITFTRTLTGRAGSLTVTGSASLAFTSQTAATITGSWRVASGTGAYARASGSGSLTGSADFGAAPPTASLSYAGEIAN